MRLTEEQLKIAHRTMSGGTFHHIVMHHLTMRKSLSVVRMGDGESLLLEEALKRQAHEKIDLFDDVWNQRMGVDGMTYGDLIQRLTRAASECDYFAPSINGLVDKSFNLYNYFDHPRLVDNFFVNQWTHQQKRELYEAAENVLLIHSSVRLADEFQRRLSFFKLRFIQLSSATQAEAVLKKASADSNQLVLLCAGPCAKYIGPAIAKNGKVVIDVGNSIDHWLPVMT